MVGKGGAALIVGSTGSLLHVFGAGRNIDNQRLNSFENPFQLISGQRS